MAFPGLTGERSPFWNDRLRGGILGLAPLHGRAHLLRALMEASAYRLAVLLGRLKDCGAAPAYATVVGGCSGIDIWNRIRSDATGLPMVTLQSSEATSLGTAVFCRVAVGAAETLQRAARSWRREKKRYLPDPQNTMAYRPLVARFETGIRALDTFFGR